MRLFEKTFVGKKGYKAGIDFRYSEQVGTLADLNKMEAAAWLGQKEREKTLGNLMRVSLDRCT